MLYVTSLPGHGSKSLSPLQALEANFPGKAPPDLLGVLLSALPHDELLPCRSSPPRTQGLIQCELVQ